MIDWHSVSTQDLQVLASIATAHDMGIAAMIRTLNVLTKDEQAQVVGILKQGVGNGESHQQSQRQIQLHTKGESA